MPVWAEKRGRLFLIAAAVAMFTLLLAGEVGTEDELLAPQDVLFEAFQLALLIGCTVASAVLVLRVQAQKEESLLLKRDVETIRTRGEQ